MKIITNSAFTLTALFLIAYGSLTAVFAGGEPDGFNLEQVADGIYLHKGVHVEFTDPQHDDIANIGFIVGDKCIAVIDTGGSLKIGQQLLLSIRSISDLPICYVINTHIHFDHILGNLAFKNEASHFIGHKNLKDAVEQNRDFFLEQFKNDLGAAANRDSIIGPDMTVDDTMDLDLGNRVIRLTAYQTAHSDTDLTVLDVQSKTLWTGDLVFRERIPALDGKLKGWLEVLDEFQILDINLAIPGHGTISNDWQHTFTAEKSYLTLLLTEVRKAIAEGQFLEEATGTIGSEEQKTWLLYQQHHSRNITKAFTELEWE